MKILLACKIVACLPCRRRLNRTEEDRKERQNSRASPDTADNGQGLGLRHLALIHHEARTTKILALPRYSCLIRDSPLSKQLYRSPTPRSWGGIQKNRAHLLFRERRTKLVINYQLEMRCSIRWFIDALPKKIKM